MDSFTMKFAQGTALYLQLYAALVGEIRAQRLSAGERLPSKRALAAHLAVSVNTVDAAYQMLVAEGYVQARAKSGFYVSRLQGFPAQNKRPPQDASAGTNAVQRAAAPYRWQFGTGSVDTGLFPYKVWGRIAREVFSGHPELLNHGERQGDANLRGAVAEYLREYRAVSCDAGQIIIGAGIEYLLGLLAHLLNGTCVAVEDPGYARARRVLHCNGVRTVAVPLDESGLCVSALEQSGAAAAYITPSHQFPSGIAMPIGRRLALLEWARAAKGRYLIEDDYDSEFRFDGRPLPALQGLDESGCAVYIGTFSKSVAPSIRIGYMVLPPALLARYHKELSFYSSTVSRFEQQTLFRFISEGHFARHLARLRIAYRQRRDELAAALCRAFGKKAAVETAHTGLHLLLRIQNGKTEAEILALCENAGIKITPLSEYYSVPTSDNQPVFVLGFAGLSGKELNAAANALANAVL